MAALRLLRAVLGAPGNPFVSDWALVDFYGQFHFLHFARLFHDLPGGGTPLTSLCKAHLQVQKPRTSQAMLLKWLLSCPSFVPCSHKTLGVSVDPHDLRRFPAT